ncbi:MAG: hypothetical protein EXR72_22810 [Myxococcales bacterium]|nr:hypothetical protein [Myxococcales bacterium]
MGAERHPAQDLPEAQRVDYLTAVAAVVLADGEVHAKELEQVRRLCGVLGISKEGETAVLTGARTRDHDAAREIVGNLRYDSVLRMSLITDAMVVLFADGKVDQGEMEALSEYAALLGLPDSKLVMLARYVAAAIGTDGGDDAEAEKLVEQLSEGLGLIQRPGTIAYLYRTIKK